jgi:DNA-binding transcriptional MerR regulator
MLTIGEFAGITGVSVKALRHYDEKGVLRPAEVDDRTGYRRYGEGQVRTGVLVRALRDAGVPLPEVADAITVGATEEAILAHRERVLSDRAAEDLAHAQSMSVLAALAVPVSIEQRASQAQRFVGRVVAVTAAEADELTDDTANAAFGALFLRMHEAGLAPSGPFWSAISAGDSGEVEIIGCWPVDADPPAGFADGPIVVGVLPARTELVATWHPGGDETLPAGSAHPAIVALYDSLAGLDGVERATEVRQTPLISEDGSDLTAVEVAITLRTH